MRTARGSSLFPALLVAVLGAALAGCSVDQGVGARRAEPVGGTASPSTTPTTGPSTDPAAPDEQIATDPDVTIGTLSNGLTYYVRRNTSPGGRAQMRLVIDAGSVDEQPDQSGVAHFLEHMLFNGTERFPENELIDVLRGFGAEFGADVNAWTSYDETVYELAVPTDDAAVVDTGLDVLAEWLSAATLDPVEVERERGVVLDEWRSRTQTSSGRLFAAIERLFLTGTTYADRSPIGERTAIESMEASQLRRFYDHWYRPDNAAIVVVGDIDVATIVDEIEARFGSLTGRGDPGTRPTGDEAAADDVADAVVHGDLDRTSAFVELTLPRRSQPIDTVAAHRAALLDEVVFGVIADRLATDAASGSEPFISATVDSNSHVRALDAPSELLETDGASVEAAAAALIEEFVRVDQHGFGEHEVARVADRLQASADSAWAGHATTQDNEFAEAYVTHFLEGGALPDATTQHALTTAVLADIDATDVEAAFGERWRGSQPHLLVAMPAEATAPLNVELVALIEMIRDSDLGARDDVAAVSALMEAPEPVVEVADHPVVDAPEVFLGARQLTFPNGARVIYNHTPIEAGMIELGAASPGGMSLVADADVIDGLWAPTVLADSGVGALDAIELRRYLNGFDVSISRLLTAYAEGFVGHAASDDLETLFQLVHLSMTAPRVDQTAVDQAVQTLAPLVADPATNPDAAATDAMLSARYGGEPRLEHLPTAAELATLDADGIERVARDRFGDADGWVFVLVGDLDASEVVELARRYIGTLPSSGQPETWASLDVTPPSTVVRRDVAAGTGDTARVERLYASPVELIDPFEEVLGDVVAELLTARLTDTVREAAGESYSPFAVVQVHADPTPIIETYISATGAPDRLDAIVTAIDGEIEELRRDGPDAAELETAVGLVASEYELIGNYQLIDELLLDAVDPYEQVESFPSRGLELDRVGADDVRRFVDRHLAADRYVEVRLTPR